MTRLQHRHFTFRFHLGLLYLRFKRNAATLPTGLHFASLPARNEAASFPGMDSTPLINLNNDDYFMREALRFARMAFDADEVPVGAVIVCEGRIIARAHNQVEMLKDATAHAEILAITQAANALGDWRLEGCSLFVTKEPCPMCAGAITLSRIARLVFGVRDDRAGGAGSVFPITSCPGLNHTVTVTPGVREEESRELLQTFFRARR